MIYDKIGPVSTEIGHNSGRKLANILYNFISNVVAEDTNKLLNGVEVANHEPEIYSLITCTTPVIIKAVRRKVNYISKYVHHNIRLLVDMLKFVDPIQLTVVMTTGCRFSERTPTYYSGTYP